MISVRQIHPLFAAEVTGVDLASLTPDQVATLQDASNRHAVLVFPGQTPRRRPPAQISAACSATSSRRAIIASSSA